jgi:ABC-type glycerol-3-phosphate transport system permease component
VGQRAPHRTLWPLIIPSLFGDAFAIFLLRQFLLTVPEAYLDAARIDGCGEVRVLLKVALPMMRPALAAVAMFQFFAAWNDYYGPLIYTGGDRHPGSARRRAPGRRPVQRRPRYAAHDRRLVQRRRRPHRP